MAKRVLLVIDMVNDFILPEGKLYIGPAGEEIVAAVSQEVAVFRKDGQPVFFVCDNHLPADPEFTMFPAHCVQGSFGAEVVAPLAPRKGEILIPKRRYSAFFGTDLDLHLRELGVEELVLVGVCTNICVLYTACDARMRNYQVVVPKGAVASFDEKAHSFALDQMEKVLGVTII